MSKFKTGDIVQVITQSSIYTWWTGEVVKVESEYVRVKFRTENTPLWFINDEVTLLVEAATNEINPPTKIVLLYGVLKTGCNTLKKAGINPSFAIPKKIRV